MDWKKLEEIMARGDQRRAWEFLTSIPSKEAVEMMKDYEVGYQKMSESWVKNNE